MRSGGGGNSWPPALRRRLGLPSSTCSSTKSKSNDELSADTDMLPTAYSSTANTTASTLSSHELRRYIHKTYSTLTSIQRQIHRGEESYYEQSYSHGNLLQGWDNIWIEQHHNSNSYANNSSGGGMYSSMGEDGSSNNNSVNNHAHHMNSNNKSIPIRKMPAEYRWFTSSCGTNLPITSTDNNNNDNSGSIGRVAALERWGLIDRPPTPEVQEEKQVAKQVVAMKKEEADAVTSIVDNRVEEDIDGSRSNNDNATAQSTKEVDVVDKVESNMASTMANESNVNAKDEPTDKSSSPPKVVVKEAENQSNNGQPSKAANIEPTQSHHTLSSEQSSTDAELVIEKAESSALVSKTKKDESNDITRLPDASNPSNIQSSSSDAISSSSPTAATADDKDRTNTATQSNKQTESISSNGKNSNDNTGSTMMDHPKNSIANKDSSEMTGHTTGGKGTEQERSSTSVSLPQSKRVRLDTNQLPKDDGCADDTASSNADMNANLSKEHDDDDQETNIRVQQSEPTEEEEEEEKSEALPTSSTAVMTGSSRTSSSRRSTKKRKTTS